MAVPCRSKHDASQRHVLVHRANVRSISLWRTTNLQQSYSLTRRWIWGSDQRDREEKSWTEIRKGEKKRRKGEKKRVLVGKVACKVVLTAVISWSSPFMQRFRRSSEMSRLVLAYFCVRFMLMYFIFLFWFVIRRGFPRTNKKKYRMYSKPTHVALQKRCRGTEWMWKIRGQQLKYLPWVTLRREHLFWDIVRKNWNRAKNLYNFGVRARNSEIRREADRSEQIAYVIKCEHYGFLWLPGIHRSSLHFQCTCPNKD